jgi:cytochrome P450
VPNTPRVLPLHQPNPLEPPPEHAELRATTPVAAVLTPDGAPAWLATSYDAVATVLADPRFSVEPPGGYPGNDTLFQDGPAHARLRGFVSATFGPRRVAALVPRVEDLATELVTAMAAAGPPADVVDNLAAPLSATVIAELVGVRIADHALFRRYADAALMGDGTDGGMARGWQQLSEYAAELVVAKRDEPGDDLLSALIEARDADGRLTDAELVGMVVSLVGGGYVSTRNAIAVGVVRLVAASRLADLAVDQERARTAVEEVLRTQSGITGSALPRWAREDLDLAGVQVAAGDMVLVALDSANRDPGRFAEPEVFVPDRRPNPHLAFGRGPHHCLGAALARIELGAALTALARRLPGLRLAVPAAEVPWCHGHIDSGPTALPVTW